MTMSIGPLVNTEARLTTETSTSAELLSPSLGTRDSVDWASAGVCAGVCVLQLTGFHFL